MNQNPEQLARNRIDRMLHTAGWQVQREQKINLAAATGVAVREYQTDIGPADYVLFVDKKPAGSIEAKRLQTLFTIATRNTRHNKAVEKLKESLVA